MGLRSDTHLSSEYHPTESRACASASQPCFSRQPILPQHFLCFLSEPQGHLLFGLILAVAVRVWWACADGDLTFAALQLVTA